MGEDKPTDTYLPQVQAPRFPHGWLTYLVHMDTPTIIGWTIGGKVHHESSATKVTQPKDHWKVTNPSTTPALGNLTQSSYGIQVKALYTLPILASSYVIMNSTRKGGGHVLMTKKIYIQIIDYIIVSHYTEYVYYNLYRVRNSPCARNDHCHLLHTSHSIQMYGSPIWELLWRRRICP